ncbi:MAG: hypothetical protein RIQ49_1386 [Pseudomonadota bacterium]
MGALGLTTSGLFLKAYACLGLVLNLSYKV